MVKLQFSVFVDAGWENAVEKSWPSFSSTLLIFRDAVVPATNMLQICIGLSSNEAEYVAPIATAKHSCDFEIFFLGYVLNGNLQTYSGKMPATWSE